MKHHFRNLAFALTLAAAGSACTADMTAPEHETAATQEALYGLGQLAQTWPGGVVPVCWLGGARPDLQIEVMDVLRDSWEKVANIRFSYEGNCSPLPIVTGRSVVFVSFAPGTNGSTSALGPQDSATSLVLISNDAANPDLHFRYEVIHEFGHALGFQHEQERPDNWNGSVPQFCNRVQPGRQATPGGLYLTPYFDSASIMNYCAGWAQKLSPGDIGGVRSAYGYRPTCNNRVCEPKDPAGASGDKTLDVAYVWNRKIALHYSEAEAGISSAMGWASIEIANPGDEVWLDRSFDGGRTWDRKVGDTVVPGGAHGWRTLMYFKGAYPGGDGQLRACGKAGDRPEVACTAWLPVCRTLQCDGRDPAIAAGDSAASPAVFALGRKITLHVSDADVMAWASIENGSAGDEVWIDRSWNAGSTWDGRLGDTVIPANATGWRSWMFNFNDPTNGGAGSLRACSALGGTFHCTPWTTHP